ncbi:MAG: hypothetical protein PHT19_17040 [Methylococcus sp.]|nr:hypothetical protein [Methylococcus sp.]
MQKEPTPKDYTKRTFKETVDIYRNDLITLVNNPLPVVIAVLVIILFLLAI